MLIRLHVTLFPLPPPLTTSLCLSVIRIMSWKAINLETGSENRGQSSPHEPPSVDRPHPGGRVEAPGLGGGRDRHSGGFQ